MDTLHAVLRSLRETKSRPDHLAVFREFLDHLDRIGRRARRPARRKASTKRSGKR